MNTQIITFKIGPPLGRNGCPLPEGSVIPKMRGRKTLKLSVEIQHLDATLELLSGTPCSFWACRGPQRPEHMITCSKCWAMREIGAVRATLARQEKKNALTSKLQ